jgi:hypothetical protein
MASAQSLRTKLAQVLIMSIQVSETWLELEARSLLILSVAQQINEMQMVREKVYSMEQTHLALKQK